MPRPWILAPALAALASLAACASATDEGDEGAESARPPVAGPLPPFQGSAYEAAAAQ